MKLAVALVEPAYEVNVGHVARLLKNFAVEELILIGPKADLEEARPFASKGADLLDRAEHLSFDRLKDRFDLLIGTTAIPAKRSSNIARRAMIPQDLRVLIRGSSAKACLILGRDTTGLTSEELAICDAVINIPTGSAYGTLNISHSLAIILYELTRGEARVRREAAPRALRERLIASAIHLADESGYPRHRRELLRMSLRGILARSAPTKREATLILGLTRKASVALKRRQLQAFSKT